MKTHVPHTMTPRESLLSMSNQVLAELRGLAREIFTGGDVAPTAIVAALSMAGATVVELQGELAAAAPPDFLPLELDVEEAPPARAPTKCRHEWSRTLTGDGPPMCKLCGKPKAAQGRPKGPPVATVAGVTKQDPPSGVLPLSPAPPAAPMVGTVTK